MRQQDGRAPMGTDDDIDLLSRFLTGHLSLYDARQHLARWRAQGEHDRATRFERSMILE